MSLSSAVHLALGIALVAAGIALNAIALEDWQRICSIAITVAGAFGIVVTVSVLLTEGPPPS